MKRYLLIYIVPIFCLLMFSCQDDLTYKNGSDIPGETGNLLNVEIDIPEARTRAIDMTPGAPVYLQKVWIGIYDKETGQRVGGTPLGEGKELDLQNRLTASGEVIKNLIPVGFYNDEVAKVKEFGSDNELCVVGVANYDPHDENLDMMTNKGKRLIDELRAADTWEKFKEIAIDTQSEGFVNQTPLLMGYLYNTEYLNSKNYPDFVYTKIDQFKEGPEVNLICRSTGKDTDDRAEPIWVHAKKSNAGIWELDADDYQLRLRRLRSKMNIEFVPYYGVTIKALSYQVHNKPNSVYLGQRLTNDFSKEGKDGYTYSPNSADRPSERGEKNGYINDEQWIVPENIEAFSFEHFENKHWVKPLYDFKEDYHKREANDLKGTFFALADEASDWNNKASYIILNMSIEDRNTGRNADVKYVIHEGYCNNQYGTELKPGAIERLNDFQCIRNTNYTYRIQVRGVNDIVVQAQSSNSATHPTDQGGSVWQMKYVGMYKINSDGSPKLNSKEEEIWSNQIKSYKEEIVDLSENPITFSPASVGDIAFRLVGQSKDDGDDADPSVAPVYTDVCFNFRRGELDGFANLWPNPSEQTHYLVNTDAGESPLTSLENFSNADARKILDKILVRYTYDNNTEFRNIKQYIEDIYDAQVVLPITGFKFKGLSKSNLGDYYDASNPRNNIRALYIFDREKAILNGRRVPTDKDESIVLGKDEDNNDIYHECSFLYEIVAAEQLPYDPDEIEEEIPDDPDKPSITFGMEDIVWSDHMVTLFSTGDYDSRHWFGGREVCSMMYWKHKEGIMGYKIEIYDYTRNGGEVKTGLYERMYLSETDIERYKDFDGILHVPFTTTRYSVGAYRVIITPTFDNSKVANEPMSLELDNALVILENPNTNDFSKTPWKSLSPSIFTDNPGKVVEYNGLQILNEDGRQTMPNSSNYIQFDNTKADTNDKCFWLYIHEPGTITVNVANTGGYEGRYLQLYKEINGEMQLVDSKEIHYDKDATTPKDIKFTIEEKDIPKNPEYPAINEYHPYIPTKFVLTSTNNCRYYKIGFSRTRN